MLCVCNFILDRHLHFVFGKSHIVECTLYNDSMDSTFAGRISVISDFCCAILILIAHRITLPFYFFEFSINVNRFICCFLRFEHGVPSILTLQCAYICSVTFANVYMYSLISSPMKVRNHFQTVLNLFLPLRIFHSLSFSLE